MSDMHDSWFFVGVFVFIFLIWIVTGGPLHPIAFSGPTLAEPQELGGGTYLELPRSRHAVGGTEVLLPGSSQGGGSLGSDTTNSGKATGVALVGGTTFGEVSPYRNAVSLNHYVSGAGAADPKNEYLTLSISSSATVPVDISGWTLLSESTGSMAVIPKGTETPTSGTVNASQDIVLAAGDRALIISGQSPIGASFRENKCIGYFSTFQNFSPSLPMNCPAPSDELAANYGSGYIRDTACIDYVNTIPRCKTTLSPPSGSSYACQTFIVKYLNYNGCVTAHRGDGDFKGITWRVYLGRPNSMWSGRHEIVKLLDANGKTVDAFSY
jgi:hypothetical protein